MGRKISMIIKQIKLSNVSKDRLGRLKGKT